MSKTAQRKRSAYQRGYGYGFRGVSATVSSAWIFADNFRAGYRAGQQARAKKDAAVVSIGNLEPNTEYRFTIAGGSVQSIRRADDNRTTDAMI